MALTQQDKIQIAAEYGATEGDTGSPQVQVALLTARIDYLTKHFKTHAKDHASRRGLLKLVGQRRRLLKFIRKGDEAAYKDLIQRLGLRR